MNHNEVEIDQAIRDEVMFGVHQALRDDVSRLSMDQIPLSLETDIDTRAATSDYQRHTDAFEAWKVTKILLDQAQKSMDEQFNKTDGSEEDWYAAFTVIQNARRAEEITWATLKAVSDHIHRIR